MSFQKEITILQIRNKVLEVLNKEMIAENLIIGLVILIGIIVAEVLMISSYSLINRDKTIYNKSVKRYNN